MSEETDRRSGRCSRPSGQPGSLCRPFDGFHAVPASVAKTCLVRFDNNKYSVAMATRRRPSGRDHAYADRIVIRQDGVDGR
jgi:hypothetical protein